MGGDELKYVKEAFDTNWISPAGPHLEAFELSLAEYVGIKSVAVLSSGTAAIHLALIILGVDKGDEVICSTFTFTGSCNPIIYQRATPVFVDSEKDTWNMDPDLLEETIKDRIKKGKKPKAIILVHLYGVPAKMDEIINVARYFEIPIIEDAAEALGSKYKGKYTGVFGDIGIYSFNGNKIITTSGGGALVSSNSKHVDRAKYLATQARDEAAHYEHTTIGYNYRMSNICAGIGRGQLEVLDEHILIRRQNFSNYCQALQDIKGITFLKEPEGTYCNRWLTTILVDKKELHIDNEYIRKNLEMENIESRLLWKPMHLQPIFKDAPKYIHGISSDLFERGLCLPSGSNMTIEEFECIISNIRKLIIGY